MQIHFFNGTNFINAARTCCLTCGPTRSWRNGDAQCCQLSNIADPFSEFFSLKKKHPNLISFLRPTGTAARARGLALPPPLSLSLSVCVSAPFRACGDEQHWYYVASQIFFCNVTYDQVWWPILWIGVFYMQVFKYLYIKKSSILHASITEITAQLLSLCVFDFIRQWCDYQDFCSD